MPYLIKVKNADFSAVKSATVTPSTLIVSGLMSYYRLAESVEQSRYNYANNTYDAVVTGTPTMTSLHAAVNDANKFTFSSRPQTGDRTFAVIMQGRAASGVHYPIMSWAGSPTTNGAEYLNGSGLNIGYVGTVFNPATGAYATNLSISAITLEEGRYDLLIVRMKNGISGELIRKRDSTVRSVVTANDTEFPSPAYYGTTTVTSPDNAHIAMFAHWSRALSDAELNTFYAEQQAVFANYNI